MTAIYPTGIPGYFLLPHRRQATEQEHRQRGGIDTLYELTGHGFRAMARTILEGGYRPEVIDLQLAHAVKDPPGRAYHRTIHLPECKRMMQRWADYLDKLKAGELDKVVSIRRVG